MKIDRGKCAGCGTCTQVCLAGAITVGRKAEINLKYCLVCGTCMIACQNEAISMSEDQKEAVG
ncbi:MAG: 4Fe-4S binding protein [Acidobacteriota bacterium]